jgi:hypothetical protein
MGPNVVLNACASTRMGPPGDTGTGVDEGGYYINLIWSRGTTDFVLISRFSGHVFGSCEALGSTGIFPVGMSSASLCVLTLDSRILLLDF